MAAIYHWIGMQGGEQVEGDIEAPNEDGVRAILQEQGIEATSVIYLSGEEEGVAPAEEVIEEEDPNDEEPDINFRPKKVKNIELIVFTKKLATMVESGLPILKTLEMLRNQAESPNFQKVVHHIYKSVEAGATLSESFMRFPTIFDTVYINLLKAGETSGKLTLFLKRLVISIEKDEKIKKKVKSALMYPIILTCVAIAVITLMMVKVVPVFAAMFGSMGGTLPAPTQLIITISDFFRNPMQGGALFAVIFGGISSLKYSIKKSIKVKRAVDKMMLKLPILGEIVIKSTLAKIAMIEGNLSAAGVAVLDALDIVARSVTNELYKEAILDVKTGIASGKTLSSLYASHEELFPPTFSQMLAVGEETGNMDGMFESTALYYEEEFDLVVERLTEMLEPIMIVFMGLTVGFIIVAMYMPIFQIGDMVGG